MVCSPHYHERRGMVKRNLEIEREAKRRYRQEHLEHRQAVGKTLAGYCIDENLSIPRFTYWKVKLLGQPRTSMPLICAQIRSKPSSACRTEVSQDSRKAISYYPTTVSITSTLPAHGQLCVNNRKFWSGQGKFCLSVKKSEPLSCHPLTVF